MNRRKFIQLFVSAVAFVAIGMKLARGMPELPQRVTSLPLEIEDLVTGEITRSDWSFDITAYLRSGKAD